MVKEVSYTELLNSPHRHTCTFGASSTISKHSKTGNMKKYYQATLLAVALLSLVSLLIYRHEYNRLRYVLEVLNFYGEPGEKGTKPSNCLEENLINSKRIDSLFNLPLPSWQRLNNDLYVYSAYRISKNEIKAIAFGKIYDSLNMDCNIYFEGKTPILGIFKYSKINENSDYAGYQLICEYEAIGTPDSVAFFNTNSADEIPILNVKNSPDNLLTNEIALCVAPAMNRSISRTDMISFLNFHQNIGIPHFIIYDYGVPSRFTETIKDIIISQGLNMSLTNIPWNFPFSGVSKDIVKEIVETDCLYRTYNNVEYSTTLYWEEYLVLKYHHNLLDFLKDFEKNKTNNKRYFIDTSIFCTQQKNDKLSTNTAPTAFRKTGKISSNNIKTYDIHISKPHESLISGNGDDTEITADLINVNHYRYCPDPIDEINFVYDRSILRLVHEMQESTFYKEYIARKVLSRK